MKISNFTKSHILKTFSIYLTCLILLNGILFFSFTSYPSDYDQNNYPQLITQEVSATVNSLCTKVNIKLLSETYSDNFYSFEYCFKKLGRYPKIFTIISETDSEQNIRLSSFHISQSTTST